MGKHLSINLITSSTILLDSLSLVLSWYISRPGDRSDGLDGFGADVLQYQDHLVTCLVTHWCVFFFVPTLSYAGVPCIACSRSWFSYPIAVRSK